MEPTEPSSFEQGSVPDSSAPGFPEVSPTGDASVDEVLNNLNSMTDLDEAAQLAAYERLHDELLAELNTEHG